MAEGRGDPIDDAALVHEIVRGSEAALATLYDRYGEAIFASACRLTADRGIAEEVVQETFLALWNRAELFDAAAGSLAAWLHAIGRNRAIDRLRAAGRRPRLVSTSSSTAVDGEPDAGSGTGGGRRHRGAQRLSTAGPGGGCGRRRSARSHPVGDDRDAGHRTNRHPAGIPGRPVTGRNRRSAGVATWDRENENSPSAAPSARGTWRGIRASRRAGRFR